MVELTIKVSDELAEQIIEKEEQLEEILQIGLRGLGHQNSMLYEEIVQFFASRPSLEDIASLKASEESQLRIRQLLEKNQSGNLSQEELLDLDEIQQLNHMITVLKAKARRQLNK